MAAIRPITLCGLGISIAFTSLGVRSVVPVRQGLLRSCVVDLLPKVANGPSFWKGVFQLGDIGARSSYGRLAASGKVSEDQKAATAQGCELHIRRLLNEGRHGSFQLAATDAKSKCAARMVVMMADWWLIVPSQ